VQPAPGLQGRSRDPFGGLVTAVLLATPLPLDAVLRPPLMATLGCLTLRGLFVLGTFL
jgi:hypothetical protein